MLVSFPNTFQVGKMNHHVDKTKSQGKMSYLSKLYTHTCVYMDIYKHIYTHPTQVCVCVRIQVYPF